jgi:hypothetical protein
MCRCLPHRLVRGDNGTQEGRAMGLKLLSAALAAISLSLVCVHTANAAGGCGIGFHRGPYGGCRPNAVVVVPGAPVVVAPAPVVAPVVCGPGYRWHPGYRRCVVL